MPVEMQSFAATGYTRARNARTYQVVESEHNVYQNRPTPVEPFSQTDWPLPSYERNATARRLVLESEHNIWQNRAPLRDPDDIPISQTDWPLPSYIKRADAYQLAIRGLWDVFQPPAPTVVPDPIPIAQFDWPLPSYLKVRRARQIALRSLSDVWQPPAPTLGYYAVRNDVVLANGTFTVSLAAAAVVGSGGVIVVKNIGTGTITVDADGAETIDGAATFALLQNESIMLMSTGTTWYIL